MKQKWPQVAINDIWEGVKNSVTEPTVQGRVMDRQENTESNDNVLRYIIANVR